MRKAAAANARSFSCFYMYVTYIGITDSELRSHGRTG